MRRKINVYPIVCLLSGAGLITLGIIILAQASLAISFVAYVGGSVVIAHGLVNLVSIAMKRHRLSKANFRTLLAGAFINITAGIAVIVLKELAIRLIYLVFTIYVLANGIVKLIDFILKYWNDVRGCWVEFAQFLFFFTFAILMVFVPNMGAASFQIVAGLYCILYGVSWILDFLQQIMPPGLINKTRLHKRLGLPVVLSTFRPFVNIRRFRHMRRMNPDMRIPTSPETYYPEGKKTDVPPDLEMMIHVSNEGVGIIGHCDTYFDGEILSYGSYDTSTLSLFGGVGDGVFFTAEKEKYLRFSVTHDSKTIFGYGLRLTDEQKEQIRYRIKELKNSVYPWKAPMHRDWEEKGKVLRSDYKDYGSKLWNGTGAHYYKFRDGEFKTYFVMTSNCVLLADTLIRPAGINILGSNGILSPGSYYDYFESQLYKGESCVFCKTVYNRDTTADWEGKFPEVIPPEDFLPEEPADEKIDGAKKAEADAAEEGQA